MLTLHIYYHALESMLDNQILGMCYILSYVLLALTYVGHTNHFYQVSCTVENKQKIIFSVQYSPFRGTIFCHVCLKKMTECNVM